jgi:hypothetical protein
MDKVLRILLRMEGASALRRSIRTVSPGETYLHNWHVDAIAISRSGPLRQEPAPLSINQPPFRQIDLHLGHPCRLAADYDRNATVCGGLPQPALGRFGRVFTSSPGRSRALGPAIGALVMIAGTRYYFERSTRLASLSAIKLTARHAVAKVMRYGILRSLSG